MIPVTARNPKMMPLEAENEILEQLYRNYEISSDEAARIAKKYGVKGNPEDLQTAYRKKQVQRFLGEFTDHQGRREIMSVPDGRGGRKYVLVALCNDKRTLKRLKLSIHRHTRALGESEDKVCSQIASVDGKLIQLIRR